MFTNSPYTYPTTTPVPDEVFDLLMYQLTGAELKVLLYICRRTFGFKQDEADISLNQLINGTRLSRDSVTRVARALESKGVIIRTRRESPEKGNEPTTYALNFLGEPIQESD